MDKVVEILSQPWPWYVAGPLIALIMGLLIYFGNTFGISSNFRTVCAMTIGGKQCSFFDFNWKDQIWNLVFLGGTVIGGFLASEYLSSDLPILLNEKTIKELVELKVYSPEDGINPTSLFNWETLFTLKGFLIFIVGGFLVGFGTRYAGGCTSGHAISGLSNLQLPSLIAVVGFFIGGLVMTYFLLPFILSL
ncbi:YeeE/YedE family protein [Membranihabitans maritimus]|uniref:YeeE/YedE family protein n=1 Tax=Membranihabitans maritimus TaxID=2904244 RepID=UPI001F455F13|nr:YeeE/YedE thiosulfate transporter family protein [Membranihabitans maritimus]